MILKVHLININVFFFRNPYNIEHISLKNLDVCGIFFRMWWLIFYIKKYRNNFIQSKHPCKCKITMANWFSSVLFIVHPTLGILDRTKREGGRHNVVTWTSPSSSRGRGRPHLWKGKSDPEERSFTLDGSQNVGFRSSWKSLPPTAILTQSLWHIYPLTQRPGIEIL